MDELSILQLYQTNFKDDDFISGKRLLFESLGKLDQMPSRRRDGTDKSIQAIMNKLKKTDPDNIPDFVAKDLSKLPPVTFDHVDVTRLLKDITRLKAETTKMQSRLEVSDEIIAELRTQVLQNAGSVIRSPEASKVYTGFNSCADSRVLLPERVCLSEVPDGNRSNEISWTRGN